jgi:23S rRNA (uridine2479-2'-O)-methyltransferase
MSADSRWVVPEPWLVEVLSVIRGNLLSGKITLNHAEDAAAAAASLDPVVVPTRSLAARILAPDLLAELGEKADGRPELVAVAELPADDLDLIPADDLFLGIVLDRPASPGNIGSIIRSADAFGAHGVIVTGHAADVYDPRSVRASTGSLFTVPVVRCASHREVAEWLAARRAQGWPVVLAGADEHGDRAVFDADFTGPTLLVVGNEGTGLSSAWRDLSDCLVSIPMTGAASSLNAANAATAILYEAARQRILAQRNPGGPVGRLLPLATVVIDADQRRGGVRSVHAVIQELSSVEPWPGPGRSWLSR